MAFLSFVIPVYNAEKYLHQCLESIARQASDETEIVLVDDGSTDSSVALITGFFGEHPHLSYQLIRRENGGSGAARNTGIAAATGDYLWFVDADDYILPDALPRLLNLLKQHKPDVFIANYCRLFPGGVDPQAEDLRLDPIDVPVNIDDIPGLDMCSFFTWDCAPWRTIARRSLYADNNIRFPEHTLYEDHVGAILLMSHAETLFFHRDPLYVYRMYATSTSKAKNRRVFDFITIRSTCLDLFEDCGWTGKYRETYLSYLLPDAFLRFHVPFSLRGEFMAALKEETLPRRLAEARTLAAGHPRLLRLASALETGRLTMYLFRVQAETVVGRMPWARAFFRFVRRGLRAIFHKR
ncbi:MAG: glycosyltransferase family 2 protein [Methylobacteriaceae bacterium]|jgi:glycosyltransferase involved in cell wall biosynthesis|nr:glycosyltransferase family 2 protein [Methylobacteriaceae bacterium]